MGVTINKKTAPDAPAPEMPAKIRLEMTIISRYVVKGQLYEKGKVYEFLPEQAEEMLRLQDDRGIPVFRQWRAKVQPKRVDRDGPVLVDMSNGAPVGDDTSVRVVNGRLEVGDDDELRAEGIELPDDDGRGDMSRSSMTGVRV